MRNKLRLLALVLAIPLVGFGVAEGIQIKTEHDWQQAIQKQLGQKAEFRQELTLHRICADSDMAKRIPEVCSEYGDLGTMETAALWTGASGLTLLLVTALLGRISRFNRRLLLAFKPALYLTIVSLLVLIPLNAALAIFALYLAESTLIGRVHVGIILAIGLGALAGILGMIRGTLGLVKRAQTTVIGKRLDEAHNPRLAELVTHLAGKLGAVLPEHIVVGLNPNFFVTEADVQCLDGRFHGRTLFLSLPLCRILSVRELEAVIGHELGHYIGLDTQFSRKFFPIYRGASESLAAVAANAGQGARLVALLPAITILSFFLDCFSVAENRVSRERELTADQVAARAVDPRTFAVALVKIHAFMPCWQAVLGQMRKSLEEGKQIINSSLLFEDASHDLAVSRYLDECDPLQGLSEHRLPHPTDSHPPLGIRLESLSISMDDVTQDAIDTCPEPVAIDLIADFEPLEEDLTDVEHSLLVKSGQVSLPPPSLPVNPKQS